MFSFLRRWFPTATEPKEESRFCVCHKDKDGNVMYFMLRRVSPKGVGQSRPTQETPGKDDASQRSRLNHLLAEGSDL